FSRDWSSDVCSSDLTEDHYPPGQSRRALISAEHLLDKLRMDTGAAVTQALGTDIRQHRPPERGLPAGLRLQRQHALPGQPYAILTLRPVVQPVGPVHLILVEQIRQALGQLVALATIRIIGEEPLQRSK